MPLYALDNFQGQLKFASLRFFLAVAADNFQKVEF